jgi:hypothetical protein
MQANDIQLLINGMNAEMQRDRMANQMTLGKMIDRLAQMPPEATIDAIEYPHSYRGYYCDLAFERREGRILASNALIICKSAMGEVFEGYKGGDYQMGRNTPVWLADYGSCGQKIVNILDDGSFELEDDE